MKRYSMRIEFDGNYYNIEKVPSSHGSWVDADIAQELYDALETAMKYFDQVIIETGYQSEGEAIAHNKCKQALSNADED